MSAASDLLADAFGRIGEGVGKLLNGLSPEDLARRVEPGANPIGWLIWHLVRVQDSHVADAASRDQLWNADGWEGRFGLPYEPGATGYGQSSDEVGAFTGDASLLTEYSHAVTEQTLRYVGGLGDGDLDRIVDEEWDPPVTLGVRLMSVVDDDLKHLGQAEYVCGLLWVVRLGGSARRPVMRQR